ncbi:hypothetical protein AVEN_129061-2-1, partial [Araneus ventricosus]
KSKVGEIKRSCQQLHRENRRRCPKREREIGEVKEEAERKYRGSEDKVQGKIEEVEDKVQGKIEEVKEKFKEDRRPREEAYELETDHRLSRQPRPHSRPTVKSLTFDGQTIPDCFLKLSFDVVSRERME